MSLVLLKPFRRLSVHGEDFKVDGDDDNWVLGRRLPALQDWPGQVEAGGERKVVLRLECLHFPLLHLCPNILMVSWWMMQLTRYAATLVSYWLILYSPHCVLLIVEGRHLDRDLDILGLEVTEEGMELVDSDALRAESTPHLAENVPQALATGNWQHVVSDSHKGVFFLQSFTRINP